MANLKLVYNADDYIEMKIRALYRTGNSFVAYDFDSQNEIEIEIAGIVGEYSCISGDEYYITVHKDNYLLFKVKQEG